MAKKLKEMEVQWRKEKEEASEAFQQERKVNLTSLEKSIAKLLSLINHKNVIVINDDYKMLLVEIRRTN